MTLSTILQTLEELEKAATYEIKKDGRIFSNRNWRGYGRRELKQALNSHGYPVVRLIIEGRAKTFRVHSLVLNKFKGPKPSTLHECCHIDGNRENNNISNLRWGTRKENAADRARHGNCKAAENGRKSAYKIKGRFKPICVNGHRRKKGKYACPVCARKFSLDWYHENKSLRNPK